MSFFVCLGHIRCKNPKKMISTMKRYALLFFFQFGALYSGHRPSFFLITWLHKQLLLKFDLTQIITFGPRFLSGKVPQRSSVEIHHSLLSQFSLLSEFFTGKLPLENYNSRVLVLMNLDPGICLTTKFLHATVQESKSGKKSDESLC